MAKIVHFGKYYFPDAGGIENVTRSLARGAMATGHDVSVVCFKRGACADPEVIDGIRVIRAPVTASASSQPLGMRYVRLCLAEAHDADIVHLHVPNMLGALCCQFLRKSTRLVVHWHSDVINKQFLSGILRPLETALLRRAECIVATSHPYASSSRPLRRFRHKIIIIPVGVSGPKMPLEVRDGVSKLPVELKCRLDGKRLVLAVGRLVLYKGFEFLVRAAKDFDNEAILVIVGDGPLYSALRATIDHNGLGQRVYLAGRLGDDLLHELFCRAEIYCMASVSRAEAFGVVLVEAMAYGLPIVATNIPGSGVPWVNQHGVTGLNVPIQDQRALAKACNQVLRSDEERARLSEGGRRRFISEFTETAAITRMNAVYAKLLSIRPSLHQRG